jgi:hypothetical protein
MITLPSDWETEPASGWPRLRHLRHACGWRSYLAYDLTDDDVRVRRVFARHRCQDGA